MCVPALVLAMFGVNSGMRVLAGHPPAVNLFSEEEIERWQLTPGYQHREPWGFDEQSGIFQGHDAGSWVAHPAVFEDFTLEVEIRFNGHGEGGIVLRGDGQSAKPWESGYELDIDTTPTPGYGKIDFPVKPRPYPGSARITLNEWHTLTVKALDNEIRVILDGKPVIEFTDREFTKGQILLEHHTGGVQYRNLTVTPKS